MFQPIEHTTSFQRQHGVHIMSSTTHKRLVDTGTTSCVHEK